MAVHPYSADFLRDYGIKFSGIHFTSPGPENDEILRITHEFRNAFALCGPAVIMHFDK